MNPSRFAHRLQSAARLTVAMTKALRSLKDLDRIADYPPRESRIEGIERRLLLSAYTLNTLATFGVNASGAAPQGSFVADASGNLYGTAFSGGAFGYGTVFEIAKGSNAITTLASFNGSNGWGPAGALAIDANGDLYGATDMGTASQNGYGTIFEIAQGTEAITTLASFGTANASLVGSNPIGGVTLDSAGNLFGTAQYGGGDGAGTVFEIAHGTKNLTVIGTFDQTNGANPEDTVTLDSSGNLWGTTILGGSNSGGTVFEIAKGSTTVTSIPSFEQAPQGGENPAGGVAFDAAGDLFGTALNGGPSGFGTVFEIAHGSTAITTLAYFSGQTLAGGYGPRGPIVLDASGNLYGTAGRGGGIDDQGVLFELPAGSGTMTRLASFAVGSNAGNSPTLAEIGEDGAGNLYVAPNQGGANGTGSMFELPAGSQTVTTLASFDLVTSDSSVACDAAGDLFGINPPTGGVNSDGTVFEIPSGSNSVSVIATFTGSNGANPDNGVTVDAAGNVFGATQYGGSNDSGTIYEIAAGTTSITTLASFPQTDEYNYNYWVGLTLDKAGNIYGVTYNYDDNQPEVFELAKGSGTITVLAASVYSQSPLVVDSSGDLYGTTHSQDGTVFEIAKNSGTATTLASFNGTNGEEPDDGPVVVDSAGNIFGATYEGGADGFGTLYEIASNSHTITALVSFSSSVSSSGGIISDAFGNLYGTTTKGGTYGDGTVFELPKGSSTLTTRFSFSGTSEGVSGLLSLDSLGNFLFTTPATLYTNPVGALASTGGTALELAANTQITLAPEGGSTPSNASQSLAFTASVAGGIPDGEMVELLDTSNNNAIVATGTLSGGSATLTIPADTLLAGTHNLIAVYGGDANFAASESAPYTQTILADVTAISPSTGPAAGGTTVTITGAGFTGANAVDFGSTPATSFTVNSTGTQITAVDPAGAAGTTVDVTVITPGGTTATSVADEFTYLPSWLAAGSVATWNASTDTLTVTGPATITADPGGDEPNIVASGSSAIVTVDPATIPVDIHIGGISLTDGASIVMSDVDASQVASGTNAANHNTDHNVLVIGTLGAVNDPTISIDSASKLDLGDNDLIVHTGSSDTGTDDVQGNPETNELKAIEALAAEGRNVAPGGVYDGTWTGNGLTSSAAATADSGAYAGYEQNILAVEQNSDMYLGGYSSWTVGSAIEKLGANDIIVKYTYNGDLNLDGAVDGNAATIFSTFYDGSATSGNTYANGDLNGDGKIDGNDATIFSTVYGNGLAASGLPQL